ncbi:MAG: glycine cleavage system protein H [Candidatus Helarchaeales archaeon]
MVSVTIGDATYDVPDNLKYNKSHQWVDPSTMKVGITDYAQKALKELVLVDFMLGAGDTVKAATEAEPSVEPFASVESTKAVSDVYSPISGTIKETNSALEDDPTILNSSPFGDGWMIIVEPSNKDADLANLLDASGYAEYIKSL